MADPKKMKISIVSQSFKYCYFIIKRLTKFGFYVILPVLKHYRTISADLRKPLDIEVSPQNHVFWTKSGKYWFWRSSYEEFLQNYFCQKVWMILNIFNICDIFSKWILIHVELNEVALKIVIFGWFHSKIPTSELTERTVIFPWHFS